MLRPCPNVSDCPPDDPIGNYSSEAFDGLDYITQVFAGSPPPLLHDWSATECGQTFVSKISQLDADLMARSAAELCNYVGSPPYINSPQTCCFPCAGGGTSCYTVPGGLFPGINQDAANGLANEVACLLASRYVVCMSAPLNAACINQPFLTAMTTLVPVTWSITGGSLPPGLTISASSQIATIHGTPTVAGAFTFQVKAQRFDGPSQVRIFTICVIDIAPASATLPTANLGTAYTSTFSATACAGTGLAWSVVLGTLPPGLHLDPSTGVLSGTPTTAGSYMFTVQLVAT